MYCISADNITTALLSTYVCSLHSSLCQSLQLFQLCTNYQTPHPQIKFVFQHVCVCVSLIQTKQFHLELKFQEA